MEIHSYVAYKGHVNLIMYSQLSWMLSVVIHTCR